MRFLRDFNRVLPIIGRRAYYANLVLLVAASLVEVGGVAILYPYLEFLLDPRKIRSNVLSRYVFDTLQLQSENQFLVLFGIGAIVFVVASGLIGAYSKVALNRFIWNANVVLTRWLYTRYLRRPYSELRRLNADTIAKNVLNEVSIFTNGLLVPWSELVSRFIVISVWVTLLFVVSPVATLIVVAATAAIYGGIYRLFSRRLSKMSNERFEMQEALFDYVNSSFRSLKDIKVNESEDVFIRKIERPAVHFSQLNHHMTLISQLPRYVIETGLFSAAVLVLLLNIGSTSIATTIPLLSLYAMAGFRLIPHVQNLFAALARIRFNTRALEVIIDELRDTAAVGLKPEGSSAPRPRLTSIEAIDVTFRFPDADKDTITGASVRIDAGQTVIVLGKSGSGKSTFIELLLGLQQPVSGRITCNGVGLAADTVLAGVSNIGYVSQEIVLFEGTLRENICLHRMTTGEDSLLKRVIQLAELTELTETLAGGVEAQVLESGKNLSAGQRQRIALARALYRDPDLLILDEATSALDGNTEQQIMKNLSGLGITILLVTHHVRLKEFADQVIDLTGAGSLVSHMHSARGDGEPAPAL